MFVTNSHIKDELLYSRGARRIKLAKRMGGFIDIESAGFARNSIGVMGS